VDKRILDSHFLAKLDLSLMFGEDIFVGQYALNPNVTARMFSDCICASCPITEGIDILNFVYALEALQLHLANSGIFIQGGLSVGLHYETPHMIFSKGLIDAYHLQKDHAIYPRILLSDEFLELADLVLNVEEQGHLDYKVISKSRELHVLQDDDGLFFLNYLAAVLLMESVHPRAVLLFANDHKNAIQNWANQGRINGVSESETKKHKWVIGYHNKFFGKYIQSEQGLIISESG
jgi:hypothetical protein